MTTLTTLECAFALPRRQGRGTKNLIPVAPPETRAAERVPRIARLMALALRFEDLVRTGKIHSYAELARLGHVTRARMTQIMNLRLLAADIQEEILFLPTARCGRDLIHLRLLQPIAKHLDWEMQRRRWADLRRRRLESEGPTRKAREKPTVST